VLNYRSYPPNKTVYRIWTTLQVRGYTHRILPYFSNWLTWPSPPTFFSEGRLHYSVLCPYTSFGRRSFAVTGPAAWNSLSQKLRRLLSQSQPSSDTSKLFAKFIMEEGPLFHQSYAHIRALFIVVDIFQSVALLIVFILSYFILFF